MRKILILFGFILLVNTSCEKDDFCLQNPVTPNLILRFYDDVNRQTLKPASGLYVWADGKDSIYMNQSTDSLVIPLNGIASQTIYNISKNNIINQLKINYTPEDIFVSRSCGYKVIFNNVTFSSNNSWFTDFTPSSLTLIDNQNAAHVQVYH